MTESLGKSYQAILAAVEKVDFSAYHQAWLNRPTDNSVNSVSWELLLNIVQQQCPAGADADQIKILKSLLTEHELDASHDWISACEHSSLEVVKVLLAHGYDIDARLLARVSRMCLQSELIGILLLLLEHLPYNLNWLFIYGEDRYSQIVDFDIGDYDYSLTATIIQLDKAAVSRAVLFNLNKYRAINTIKLLVGLGYIDVEAIREYNEDDEDQQFLTQELIRNSDK